MTKIIGLTGGIGSGKTMVANYIKSLGIPVYIADDEAKKIMKTEEVIDKIRFAFGKDIIENDTVNKEKLSKIVFDNPENLQRLNTIIHPLVKKHFEYWLKNYNNFPFVVKEAAILFESGSYKYCNSIITITSPLETRIQRVIVRDKTSRESILKRIQNQWSDEEKVAKSDYIIHNLSVEDTKKQIDEVLKILKNQ